MTKWLTRQEACHRFASYFSDCPRLSFGVASSLGIKEDEDNGEEDEIEEGDDEEQSTHQGYSIAQRSAYSQLPIASLSKYFVAMDFLAHLTTFPSPFPSDFSHSKNTSAQHSFTRFLNASLTTSSGTPKLPA